MEQQGLLSECPSRNFEKILQNKSSCLFPLKSAFLEAVTTWNDQSASSELCSATPP